MKHFSLAAACAASILVSGCGGGSGPASDGQTQLHSEAPAPSAGPARSASPAPTQPTASLPALPLPVNIASGSTVNLECGRLYVGTLDLRGKSDVTVRTDGSCGKAVISPGQPLGGWVREAGNVYSAPASGEVGQVIFDGVPLPLAHWPNQSQGWARAAGSGGTALSYAMPNPDLTGARLVFKPYVWAIESRRVTGYTGNTMTLAVHNEHDFGGYPLGGQVEFYVEGKLWMLDSPGEWAQHAGRLYVWTPDGQSPQGRVWVSPERDGIDAAGSRRVKIEAVDIFAAANGIHARDAHHLQVIDTGIANSAANGILNSGGSALRVERSTLRNIRHDAITVRWGGGSEVIRGNRIENAGSIGMPTNARAAINLTLGSGATVENNLVAGSGYIGIRAYRNAVVSGNTVQRACLVLTDCGGIYADAVDGPQLHTRIENNSISGVGSGQRLAWGIFLGERANAVTISGNRITDNANGIQLLNAYDVRISGNSFARNAQAHIQMVEYGITPAVMHNIVSGNTFTTQGREEMYRISSEQGTQAVGRFASYAQNTYLSASTIFANYNGEALSFAQWKIRTGQDGDSSIGSP